MCKQNKQRNKRIARKAAKFSAARKESLHHYAEGEKKSPFPHLQPKPNWIKPSGKKGWWNAKKRTPHAMEV